MTKNAISHVKLLFDIFVFFIAILIFPYPLSPNIDQHLISPYIASQSNINVMGTK